MSIGLIVVVILLLFLFGGLAPWGAYSTPNHFYGTGLYGGGGLGLVLAILIILLVLGRL